jgi:hypothetical protein
MYLLTLVSCQDSYLTSYCTDAKIPTCYYFDYMRVANTVDSQKSEERDITDKLL